MEGTVEKLRLYDFVLCYISLKDRLEIVLCLLGDYQYPVELNTFCPHRSVYPRWGMEMSCPSPIWGEWWHLAASRLASY